MYYVCHCITQSLNHRLFRLPSNVCLVIEVDMGVLARTLQKAGSVVQSLMGPARQIHAAPKIAPVNHL